MSTQEDLKGSNSEVEEDETRDQAFLQTLQAVEAWKSKTQLPITIIDPHRASDGVNNEKIAIHEFSGKDENGEEITITFSDSGGSDFRNLTFLISKPNSENPDTSDFVSETRVLYLADRIGSIPAVRKGINLITYTANATQRKDYRYVPNVYGYVDAIAAQRQPDVEKVGPWVFRLDRKEKDPLKNADPFTEAMRVLGYLETVSYNEMPNRKPGRPPKEK